MLRNGGRSTRLRERGASSTPPYKKQTFIPYRKWIFFYIWYHSGRYFYSGEILLIVLICFILILS